MNMRSLLARWAATRRSRFIAMVAFVLLLLLVSRGVEYALVATADARWEQVSEERSTEVLAAATSRFGEEQRALERVATGLSTHAIVLGYLSQATQNREDLFALVAEVRRSDDVGIEVYGRDGTLAAWEGLGGRRSAEEIRKALAGRMTSYVTRTTIASQLIVVIPVRDGVSIVGAILVSRTLETNAPLNNALLRTRGLDETLTGELGLPVDFTFAGEGEPGRDDRYRSAALHGIDSTRLGSVSVLRPGRQAYLERIETDFQIVNAGLLTVLLGLCAAATTVLLRHLKGIAIRVLGVTALIWGVRYALLWLDVPSSFVAGGIFNPALFASTFGGGLAKSVGEMTITVLALTLNTVLGARLVLHRRADDTPVGLPAYAAFPLAGALSMLMYWMLRSLGAAIRSGVADSTLTYFDARVVLPSPELSFMILNFFLLGACLVAAAVGLTLLIVRLCVVPRWHALAPWVVTAGFSAAAALLFGMVLENPIMSPAYRLAFGVIIIATAYLLARSNHVPGWDALRRQGLAVLAVAGLVLYPLLDQYSHDKDRSRIEIFAAEELKPVDGWLKNIVEEGLQGFDNDEYRERLSEGLASDVAAIAFRRWSSSLACSQGYDAMFTVTDPYGREASRFVIGGSVAAMTQADTSLPMTREKLIRVRDIGTGVNALKVYAGSMPILAADSTLLGYVRVVVAAGQQSLFRGETPVILRGSSQGHIESFYRRVSLSEYRDGVLLTSNNPVVPINHPLREQVVEAFADSARMSLWADDDFDGNLYEDYYLRRAAGGNEVVALGLRDLGLAWHLVSVVKLFAAYLTIALFVLLVSRLISMRRGHVYRLTFRDRLLIALLITAILPLTILALYIRYADRERGKESIERRLDEQTQNIIYNITEHPAPGVTILNLPGDRYAVEKLASEIETDFNVYTDRLLRASSKQVLYDVGILDSRLSGDAYARILLGGERFVTQTERVGSVEYTVGYRPVLDARGDIIGVVSVPTLFRPEESEEQAARRNAFLLGAYTVVLLSIVAFASLFANRIAAPVQRLTEATRRVARGDLEVQVRQSGAEGEISELIKSFDQMTRDLQRSRKELIAYEREMAWKEMAKQVAHEIKNPLTPMRLSIQHLRRTYHDNAPKFGEIVDGVTTTIIEQIDTLSRIASEFSRFARMPRQMLGRVQVNDVVDEAVRLFDQESRVVFEVTKVEGLPEVLADREELRRALINILRNGIQAMEGDGRIALTTGRDGEWVTIAVRDTGKGVPEEIRPRLFEPNFSTKTDGMGLGLALVKQTMDELGGSVALESVIGEGTTVTLRLPAAAGQEVASS